MDARVRTFLLLLVSLNITDVTCGATARGLRLNVLKDPVEKELRSAARGRPTDQSTAPSWPNILADYGQSARAQQPATDWYSQLSKAFTSGGNNGDGGSGSGFVGSMALPFLVLPVPVNTKPTQECPVNEAEIKSNELDFGGKQTRDASPGGGRLSRPAGPRHSGRQRPPVPSPIAARVVPDQLPYVDVVASSQRLVELFREQKPTAPELPPAVIPDYGDAQAVAGFEATQRLRDDAISYKPQVQQVQVLQQPLRQVLQVQRRRAPQTPPPPYAASPISAFPPAPSGTATPPRPRFERSLVMSGKLTVPRADYSEPYTVWWDASSGAARVDLHGGATSTYRLFTANGLVQGVELKVDRTGDTELIRCAVTSPKPAQAADRALPAMPDLDLFEFAGYLNSDAGRVERWTHTVAGQAGERGAARGEALTFQHELLVTRSLDNDTVLPLRYTVAVNSTVLGADCDGYTHVYSEFREADIDPTILTLDIDGACDVVTPTEQTERVAPLKEFTLPHRDPRYDSVLLQYVTNNARQYADDVEWAVRKNLIVQASRYVASGNRQGATFETKLNIFGDRLKEELRPLFGVDSSEVDASVGPDEEAEGEGQGGARRGRQAVAGRRLPARFDWRDVGGVTHVRFQGMACQSCWAFAVAGAVEGALFAKTGSLVPLSEQVLVDCAHSALNGSHDPIAASKGISVAVEGENKFFDDHGAHGCGGTWPAFAYAYVQDRGISALEEYVPYKEKVLQCVDRQVGPVTHIRGHVNVTKFQVRALKKAIFENSPSVVVVDGSCNSFVYYSKGVIQDDRCKKQKKLNHAVLAVGFDEHRREPHFIVKNSWSDKWGDGGYARIHGPSNTCGVLTWPSYPLLERPDVDRQLAPTTGPNDSASRPQ